MDIDNIKQSIQKRIAADIDFIKINEDKYRIFTPFVYSDGDSIRFVIDFSGGTENIIISDEGTTLMHLSYSIDLSDLYKDGSRNRIFENTLNYHGLKDLNNEITGDSSIDNLSTKIIDFLQAAMKISDLNYLSRERVHSTFIEDFISYFKVIIPEKRSYFNWKSPDHDPKGLYEVDLRINNLEKPIFVFALSNNEKVRDATITLQQFENWSIVNQSVGIFENQEEINRKVLARFSDVCDKQFSSFYSNQERIESYLSPRMQ